VEKLMPTKEERLQQVWHKYETERKHKPTSAREAVNWAVAEGLLELPEVDPYDVLAGQMSQALRDEYQTDSQGRRYRVNHAVRVSKSGVQYTFWGVMGFASHEHMEKAFAQRREQIIGDNLQLKTDVDVYNDLNKGKRPPIQIVMDYTDDVAERQELQKMKPKRVEVDVA
jgi:hypothetical protein